MITAATDVIIDNGTLGDDDIIYFKGIFFLSFGSHLAHPSILSSRESETFRQFAKVDSGFLAWDFWLKDKDDRLLASINRNFRGIGRELFTDTGTFILATGFGKLIKLPKKK